jgi:hypothetical protein
MTGVGRQFDDRERCDVAGLMRSADASSASEVRLQTGQFYVMVADERIW